uniref:Uncharacterized protein n=1 Tax=Ditylenchus dipsaci TaxID=166011 RepID=A0A915E9K5_9BILA
MPSLPSPHQFFGNHRNGYQENGSRDNSQNSSSGSAHMTNDLLNYESHIRIVTPEQSSSLSDSVFASREKSQKSQSLIRGAGQQEQINSSTAETPSSPHILSPNPISNGAGDIGSEVFTVQKQPDMLAMQPEIRGKQPSRASSISHPSLGKAGTVHESPDSSSHNHIFLSPSEAPKKKECGKEKKAASLSISSLTYAPLESNHSLIPHQPMKPLKKSNSNIDVPVFQRTPLPNIEPPLNHSTPYFAEATPVMPRQSVHEEGVSEYNLNDQTAAENNEMPMV